MAQEATVTTGQDVTRAIEMLLAGIDRKAIVAELNRTSRWLRHVVSRARAKGIAIPQCKMGRRPMNRLDAVEDAEHCIRCDLRGVHVCLPRRAEEYLGRREESRGVRYTEYRRAGG